MTEQKAQQTIDRYGFKWYGNGEHAYERFIKIADGNYVEYKAHIAIVDSQAQKIAEQATELNVTTTMLNDMNEIVAEHTKTINEQEDALADFEDLYKVLTKYMEDKIAFKSLRDAYNHFKTMRG